MTRIILNKISIGNKVAGALTKKRFQGLAFNAANTRFIFAKNAAIEEFNESEVTKEILAGPTADSSFLERGNLVSFLGLENGPQSIAQVRNKLELGIAMNKTPNFIKRKGGVTYEFKVKSPSLQEIYDAAPSPWSTKSWIELTQDGVNNFIYFIFDKLGKFAKYSRSGTGLQSKHKRKNGSSGKVLGIKYLNDIMERFRARFVGK